MAQPPMSERRDVVRFDAVQVDRRMRWREVLAGLGATLAFSALAQARTKKLECSVLDPPKRELARV